MTVRAVRLLVSGAAVAMVVGTLGACAAGDDTDSMPVPSASASPSPIEVAPTGDGELSIGTLFPLTGELAEVGAAQVAGVDAAVRAINEAGGVDGSPAVVTHRDATGRGLVDAARDLADLGVDVVIGPATADGVAAVSDALAADGIPVVSLTSGPLAADGGGSESAAGQQLVFVLEGAEGPAADALRDAATPDDEFTSLVRVTDPGVTDVAYAAEAFDAAAIVALAAIAADDDGGASIASALRSVTTGSYRCDIIGDCRAALDDDVDVAFVGESGDLVLG